MGALAHRAGGLTLSQPYPGGGTLADVTEPTEPITRLMRSAGLP